MEEKQNWTYCVVGNIKKTHYDKGGTLRYGTAAFSGGTKVYLSGRLWNKTSISIAVLGITRTKKLKVVDTDVSLIENLRCQKVFKPSILEFMDYFEFRAGWWGKSKKEKANAEEFVKWWNENIVSSENNSLL